VRVAIFLAIGGLRQQVIRLVSLITSISRSATAEIFLPDFFFSNGIERFPESIGTTILL
jgi:hypothetical protein